MPTQLALRFDEVPLTCSTQERYHTIAPVLAGNCSPAEQAELLNLGYSTVTRWLRQFRKKGMLGLFPADQYLREPYTPERVIVTLLYFKCCAPKSSYFELSRVVAHKTRHRIHHETVKALLARYFFWRHEEFRVAWPILAGPEGIRLEIVKLRQAGWSDRTIAYLLRCSAKTVTKWWRRFQQSQQQPTEIQPSLWCEDLPRKPHQTSRKVFFGSIHAVLELQKKYGYAGAFRIKGYLEQVFCTRRATRILNTWGPPDRLERMSTSDPFQMVAHDRRVGSRRATVLNPSRLNAEATPVKTLRVLPGRAVSTGYASSAGALARLAAFKAAAINSDITPWRR